MFGRKNEKEDLAEYYYSLFNAHLKNESNYCYFKNLYSKIKNDYIQKIKNKEIDIKIERTRLESKAGKNLGVSFNLFQNLLVVFVSSMINGLIVALSVSEFKHKYIIILVVSALLYFMLLFMVNRDLFKSNKEDYIFNFCLRILDDIEKEIKEDKLKNNLSFQESAATIDDDMEKDSIAQKDNKGIRGLINIISITKVERRK